MASATMQHTVHAQDKERVLTCFTCRLVFDDSDKMREHYKTDFHRFNLKRKVAGLPPVQEALFLQKVAALEKQKDAVPAKGQHHIKDAKRQKAAAAPKPKTTLSAFDTEALSSTLKKPSEAEDDAAKLKAAGDAPAEPKAEAKEKTEEELIDEKIAQSKPFDLEDCLFDRHRSASFEENMRYMTKKYSFFIPEIEFLADLKGLIQYLGQKIAIGNTCIYCEKTFYSVEAVQAHMRDVSHCMIRWEDNEDEYIDFYDWSNDPRNLPISEDDEEPAEPYRWTEHNELVLANGKTLGLRQMKVYYNQRLRARNHLQLVTSLMQEHRRLEALERQKSTYIPKYILKQRHDLELKTGMKNNNQKHYRNSNPL